MSLTRVRCPLTRERGGTSWLGGTLRAGTLGGWGGGGTLVGGYVGGGGGLLDVGYVEGVRWGEGVCWRGGGVSWGGGVLLSTWRAGQKCCFWALFGKLLHIGRAWMNVFVRVLQRRKTLSLGPRPGKTAQKPLKIRSNLARKTVQKSQQETSGFWAVF